ncbi:hypothetical protein B0H13DRAFT_2660854 [Mycena leptocephala]|nr:hypothetical protein B0H13DRAFT_2660854 [Mycena leptocephala]
MLLLLIFVHLLSRNGSAAPDQYTLNDRAAPNSCNDISNCRKLFDIVWGCLATIFACTWVSVHPNVPAPNESRLAHFWRRLKMMLIAAIAPEIMVAFAARQFFAARALSKEFGFSKTHGFFFCMGGFVSSTGSPLVTKKQLADAETGFEFLIGIKNVDVKDIMDKSKGDALSKGLAMVQGLWFTMQCVSRLHQHLVITELEVATLAFAAVNIFIWLLWWYKPLDVRRQIVVGTAKLPDPLPIGPIHASWLVRFNSAIVGISYEYNPLSPISVSSFWSLPWYELDDIQGYFAPLAIEALVGTVFGAIHCAAWNTDFPTTAEMWMWRACSSVIAVIIVLSTVLAFTNDKESPSTEMMLQIGFIVPIPIYIIARLVLVILPLVALRSLPPDAFVDVNWSTYIPHL